VDPPESPDSVCRWNLYKDRYAVPARYYRRSGLEPPERKRKSIPSERWFTDDELDEMVKHTPDRIEASLRSGDRRAALRICKNMAGEFFFLHSLYVNMVISVLDFVAREAGEESLGAVISYLYEKCLREQVVKNLEGAPRSQAMRAIIKDMFLADTCGGAGFPSPRIKITEDETQVIVSLDPCGSGGKLIRRKAYEQQSPLGRTRERLENSAVKLAVGLPLPRRLVEPSMPITMDYISETRKPQGMGRTGRGYAWSAERDGLPYYCCLCTGFLAQSGIDWLEVKPPSDRRSPCVWQVTK
jgi:hypothetical protein